MANEVTEAVTLTQLFEHMRLLEAVQHMIKWDITQLRTELSQAFTTVSTAPSVFLKCVHLYTELPNKDLAEIAIWIETAVNCLKQNDHVLIIPADSQLAGSMLPLFQRLRMPLVADFALVFRIDKDMLASFCLLLVQTRIGHAVQFLKSLTMENLVPSTVVYEAVIVQKDFRAGDVYVKGDATKQHHYLEKLVLYSAPDKVIKKRLRMFHLEAQGFPVYYERRQKAAVRFLIYSNEYEQALECIAESEDLKFYACQMILKHCGVDDAATKQFLYRTGLAHQFPEVDTQTEAMKTFPTLKALPSLDSCVSLVDVIGDSNIVFINTLDALQECAKYLLKQSIIGFDTEWKAMHFSTSQKQLPPKCALLQMASREKAFVVDVLTLQAYGSVLMPVFRSESVLKLGFDTKGDVQVLRPFLNPRHSFDFIMSMLVDVQAVARLFQSVHSRVDTIVETKRETNRREKNETCENSTDERIHTSTATVWKPKCHNSSGNTTEKEKMKTRLGLTAVSALYLGLSLDKRLRLSDWERRPLTHAQLHYAALDAHVLVQIYDKMHDNHPKEAFNAAIKRCLQKHVR
ncbi:hypothetical protein CCR75_000838 [Bremia lactucae]|uniref:3'-5' exonuclease domain-containing protein n=1 Tax=Bremia lactucae TaxID=4779 RepID=A0A976FNY5_BRELC|nr:hypothetical protein CCR75_000838 [Bremia lactucae]